MKKILAFWCFMLLAVSITASSQAKRVPATTQNLSGCYSDLKVLGRVGYVVGADSEAGSHMSRVTGRFTPEGLLLKWRDRSLAYAQPNPLMRRIADFGVAAEDARQPSCLRYESAVRLRGTIRRETFPGRPNYESVERGDEPETIWLLQLARPLCATADGEDSESERDVHEVQLVLTPRQYQRWRTLVGARVVAAGKLFHSSTGHHHTRVLLNVSELKKASR